MSDSGDSYEAYDDFTNLTEAELLTLDAPGPSSPAPAFRPTGLSGAPAVQIAIQDDVRASEDDDMPVEYTVLSEGLTSEDMEDAVESPASQYRRQGIFSVSDLCGPSWCEVQFDYGLRQKRSRPLKDRPQSFRSRKGKEISVAPQVAAKNDDRTKGGKEIHKELERETMLEPIFVRITCPEERWALRQRETPVFGIIHDEVVVGIITPQGKRARAPLSHAESSSTEIRKVHTRPTTPPPTSTLSLLDTKTRTTRSMPPNEDTLSSRVQLMLYQRMLSDLVRVSPSFDFAYLWTKLDLDLLKDTGLLPPHDNTEHMCLSDVVELWWQLRDELNAEVASRLEIVYRLIPEGGHRARKAASTAEASVGQARPSSPQSFEVVGTKEFAMDDAMLDVHVESILRWWRGDRAPQGVPIELARRCHSCEYMTDCEWREAKALEAKQQFQQRRTRSLT
ncbi:exonuclease V a 5' deoxyribonuclease-domain-containing protein [Schizophyllum amplum]|uniref:Exonuclease V a 5' deoxyribonuclease-domain-containing protein n=1 Tax=Schizophyllum amplum TaxID=97359 RepID=A0A550CM23_9AGAR|nr:exonuclease V a 5' deoxyribonuclease-domain-containing protein [Auriculariopsis ampla]